jgi:hypothetical protein
MAWDISDYKLENLGVDISDPGIDWDAIAKMIADRDEAAKETEESESIPEPEVDKVVLSGPVAAHGLKPAVGSSLAEELRNLADRVEALEAGKEV